MSGLKGECLRWEESAARLEAALVAVPGDAALASAFLSYAGPFPANLRAALSAAWRNQVHHDYVLTGCNIAFNSWRCGACQSRCSPG